MGFSAVILTPAVSNQAISAQPLLACPQRSLKHRHSLLRQKNGGQKHETPNPTKPSLHRRDWKTAEMSSRPWALGVKFPIFDRPSFCRKGFR